MQLSRSPLNGDLNAHTADANLLPLFFPDLDRSAGELRVALHANGSLAAPLAVTAVIYLWTFWLSINGGVAERVSLSILIGALAVGLILVIARRPFAVQQNLRRQFRNRLQHAGRK